MPELPEVETIKLSLEKKIIGLIITKVQVLNTKSFVGDLQQVIGSKVVKVWRRAKVLGIDLVWGPASSVSQRASLLTSFAAASRLDPSSLSPHLSLLFHLKMSGQVIWKGKSEKGIGKRFVGGHPTHDMLSAMPNKHTRVIFEFSDGSHLYFNDQRKFGWVKLVNSEQVTGDSFLNKVGPEPLEKEFNWQILKTNLLIHKSQSVKVAILDQTVVAGIGNIYACEACFNAKIDPRTKVRDLTDDQFQSLYRAVQKALRDGIKYGGSTKTHFVDSDGKKGYFLDYAFVYNRKGTPCKICGTEIEKIKLGGRGTFFCPQCQICV